MTADTRERIRTAALSIFCEKGYGACVDDIARRAGVVKQTLYHHYGSKDNLFREVLKELVDELVMDLTRRSGSLRADLLRFAETYRSKTTSEQGLALHRMMVAESPRFPELSQAVYEAGLLASRALARLLKEAMARGELREDDPEFAADMLLSLLSGLERNRLLYGIAPERGMAAARVAHIVDCFLRAYAPEQAPQRVKGKQE